VVVSEEFSQHSEVLGKILQKLRAAGLKINKEKSQFCRSELKHLGHCGDCHRSRESIHNRELPNSKECERTQILFRPSFMVSEIWVP
jgi:hypothetical protein